ncbi:MAG: hypothetical protein GY757_31720, partial [bacterium]|nr:hypothetical protein [bacterium]
SLVLWGHSTGILNILESKEPIINRLFNLEAEEVVAYSHKVMIEYITPVDKKSVDNEPEDNEPVDKKQSENEQIGKEHA